MAKILDFDAVQDFDQLIANGPIVRASSQMPSAKYAAIAIGPDSDHDMVRVQMPGIDTVISSGTVLPLPLSKHRTAPIIRTVRDFDGHVQILGLESLDEATAAATAEQRTPVFFDQYFDLQSLAAISFDLPYAGRSSASIVLATSLLVPNHIEIQTQGIKVRLGNGPLGANKQVAVPLNTLIWNAQNKWAWSESEPQFDFMRFTLTNNDVGPAWHSLWVGLESR